MPKQEVACVGMRLGRYELTAVLGEGGMATVFRASDSKLNRDVAVKVMFPHLARRADAVARFKREARAAAGLDHEHILRVYDVGGGEAEDGRLVPPYIVLELVEGQSLSEYFKERSPPLAEVVAAMGVALCGALTQAHEQKIVHRDIKPANVMVTQQGRLALADFGVAHIGEEDSLVTRTGTILGTPAFMSPEQALAEGVDSRSDVYSLGATLYTIATSEMPYSGSPAYILASILDGKCKTVEELRPDMGRELSRVIQGMMHIDPEERTASAAAASEALAAIVSGGGFEDSEALLVDYFSGPQSRVEGRRKTAISSTLIRARNMADGGRVPMALSLAERVLSLDSENLQAQTLALKFGRQRLQRKWPAIVLPFVVTAAAGLLFWGNRPGSIAEYVDSPLDASREVTSVLASDARVPLVVPASEVAEDAALPIADAANGKRRQRGQSANPRHRPLPTAALPIDAGVASPVKIDASVALLDLPKARARVVVDIKPWCDVWIDGRKLGRASAKTVHEVPVGSHKIECKQPGTRLSWAKEVVLSAGKTRRFTGSVLGKLGKIMVTVQVADSQSVRIAGRLVRSGATVQLSAGRHRVELVVGGKVSGKPVYLDMRQDCTLRKAAQFSCSAD